MWIFNYIGRPRHFSWTENFCNFAILSILLLWVLFIGETDTKSEFLHINLKSQVTYKLNVCEKEEPSCFLIQIPWYKSLSSTHSNELVNQMDSNLYKMWQWFWERRRRSNSKVKGYQVWVLIFLEISSPALTVIILR